jgi:predicted Rossmann fold nucleotide-binding protein DprA/Smf involved in DNA uptake
MPATNTEDILHALGLNTTAVNGSKSSRTKGANADEQHIINLLEQGISDGSELLAASGFSVEQFNHHLTMLEITTKIRPVGANHWALR